MPTQIYVNSVGCGLLDSPCVLCEDREQFWAFVTDNLPGDVHRHLVNLPDEQLVDVLLGAPIEMNITEGTQYKLLF